MTCSPFDFYQYSRVKLEKQGQEDDLIDWSRLTLTVYNSVLFDGVKKSVAYQVYSPRFVQVVVTLLKIISHLFQTLFAYWWQ